MFRRIRHVRVNNLTVLLSVLDIYKQASQMVKISKKGKMKQGDLAKQVKYFQMVGYT